jgi:hypothetical protein
MVKPFFQHPHPSLLRMILKVVRVPVGAHDLESRSTKDVERFLSSVRFESRGKLEEFEIEIDKKSIESHLLDIAIKIE